MRMTEGFDAWWGGLREETKTGVDKTLLKRAYSAGFRKSSTPELKKFQFFAGRRRVSVSARTLNDARERAKIVLNQRAAAAGHTPPKAGWTLTLVNMV